LTSGLEQYISGCNSPFHVKKSLSKLHSFMSIGHDAISLRNLLKKTFRSFVDIWLAFGWLLVGLLLALG
jgi:hypothetical protein